LAAAAAKLSFRPDNDFLNLHRETLKLTCQLWDYLQKIGAVGTTNPQNCQKTVPNLRPSQS